MSFIGYKLHTIEIQKFQLIFFILKKGVFLLTKNQKHSMNIFENQNLYHEN